MRKNIKFPSDSEKYFNEKAKELLKILKPEPKRENEKNTITSGSHYFKKELNVPITDDIKYATINGIGMETSRFFSNNEGFIGLSGESYYKFEDLTFKIINDSPLEDIISENFVKNVLFQWLKLRYKKKMSETKEFVTYLTEESYNSIIPRRIAIPIANLEIEMSFSIGNVEFDFFRRELFDRISEKIEVNSTNEKEQKQRFMNRIRNKYQGVVFSSFDIEAEIEKSIDIARQETEMALMILRFFSPSSIFPIVPCYYGMMGKVFIPQSSVFVFENGLPTITEKVEERRQFNRTITYNEIEQLKRRGLNHASNLIKKKKRNEFEELIINCMFIFSRAVVSKSFQDKLVFTLVSAETLLLGNTSESIQSTVGSRLASLHTPKSKIQEEIKQIVKNAYRLRSAYLHHGIRKYDIQLLANLQQIVWHALRKSLIDSSNYLTKAEFLTSI